MSVVASDRDRDFDRSTPHVRRDAALWQYDDEIVAWSPDGRDPAHLDPVASLVFPFLDGSVPIGELVADVHEAVGVPETIARTQLRRVVEQLHHAGLLTTSAPSSATAEMAELDVFPAPPNP